LEEFGAAICDTSTKEILTGGAPEAYSDLVTSEGFNALLGKGWPIIPKAAGNPKEKNWIAPPVKVLGGELGSG